MRIALVEKYHVCNEPLVVKEVKDYKKQVSNAHPTNHFVKMMKHFNYKI